MKTSWLTLGCMLAFTHVAAVEAKPIKRGPAGLQLELPEGWKMVANKEALTIASEDKNLYVFGVELPDLTKAQLKEVKKNLPKMIDQIGLSKANQLADDLTTEKVNDLKQTRGEGAGKDKNDDEKEVNWYVALVEGGKVPFIVIALGDVETNKDELIELLDTIQEMDDE